jgi:hypothetical protein
MVNIVTGVAVGAGELEEENAQILAETKLQLEEVKAQLSEAKEENLRLRTRFKRTEP